MAPAQIVWCVACVNRGEIQAVHIFSSPEKRQAWVDAHESDYYMFVHYEYVVDHPERMTRSNKEVN